MEFKVEPLVNPVLDRLHPYFKRLYSHGSVKISPPGCVYNTSFQDHLDRITSFQVREDDVWVVTFPKTGTTWTQEMVWLILNNLDYEAAKANVIDDRFPFFEFSCTWMPSVEGPIRDTIFQAQSHPSPRPIKSHLHKELLPRGLWDKKPKIIYVYRDPKDVVVSYYYHNCLINGYTGPKELFFEAFLEGVLVFSPFWEHVLEFWKLRHEAHVMFNTYEQMKKNLPDVIRRTAEFLERPLTEEEVAQLTNHLSFSSMRENPSVNLSNRREVWEANNLISIPGLQFIRRGESGSWREEMTSDMAKRFDQWTREKIAGTDFPYIFTDL